MVQRWLLVALLVGCGGGDPLPPDGGPDSPALGDAAGEGCAVGTSACAGTAALHCDVVAGCPVWVADECSADGLVCDDSARVGGMARCVCSPLDQTDFFANPTVDRSERPAAEVLPTGAVSPAICTFEKLGDAVIAAAGASAGVVATRAIAAGATTAPVVFSDEIFPIAVPSLVTVTTDDDPAVTPGRTLDPTRYVVAYAPPDPPITHAIELAGTLRGLTVQQIADAQVGLVHCATGTAELDTIRLLGFAANTVRADGLVVEQGCAATATTLEVKDFATICVLVRGSLVGAGVTASGCGAGVQNLFGSVTLDDSVLTANFSGIESTGELALTNVSASGNESVGIGVQQGTVILNSVVMDANGSFFGLHAGVNGVGPPGAQITITGASSASGNGSTGIEINANSSVVAGPGLVVENNGVGVGGQGIDVFGALDATGIVVRDNNENGIKVKTIAPVVLRGVTATGNQQDGLRVLQSSTVTVVADGTTASVFSSNGLAGIRMIGEINSQALVRASFDGIEVAANLAEGIVVAGDPSRNQHTQIAITNSAIHDNAAEGMRFLTAALANPKFAGNRVFHNAMQAGCDGTQTAAQIRVTGLIDDVTAMSACSAHGSQTTCDADAANSCVFVGSCVTSYDFSAASCTSASSIFDYNIADAGAVSVGVLAESAAVAKATTAIWRTATASENVRGTVVTDAPCSLVAACQSP